MEMHSPMLVAPVEKPSQKETPSRPKIGLVFSGGGARGAAHVGVLKVLDAYGVPVDFIVGTSMGAIIGGLYASGMSAVDLERVLAEVDWSRLFDDRTSRKLRSFRRKRDDDFYLVKNSPGISWLHLDFPPGVLGGRRIDLMLKRYTLPVVSVRDFDALPIPFRAVATDLASGEKVVLDSGDLAMAMRASMSIPVVFAPREIEGRLLVDGGLSDNLPVDVARRMGAEVLIGVDVSSPLRGKDELGSVLDVTEQLTDIMTRRNMNEQLESLEAADVLIEPNLGDLSMSSFERSKEAIAAGSRAAEAQRERWIQLAQGREEAPRRKSPPQSEPLVIDAVRVENHSRLSDEVIAARLDVEPGEALDVDRLEWGLDRIYALELFESVYYDIVEENGRTVLVVDVREASWGPGYLQFGIAVFEDYEGPNFNLSMAYMRTALDRLNGEWRTGVQIGKEPGIYSELYQPLHQSLRPFVHLRGWFGEDALSLFDGEGKKTTEFRTRRWGAGIAAGRELGTWGEARVGLLREGGHREVEVGEPNPLEGSISRGETFAELRVDELDEVSFPRSGGGARIRLGMSLEALGSDVETEQASIEGSLARSVGRNTVLLGGMFASTRNSDAPLESQFRLGGFTRLSGLEQDELLGQHAALFSGSFYRELGHSHWVSLLAGFSGEYGNVFQERREIRLDEGITAGSVFLGLESPVGPIVVAYGVAEGGRKNFYFFLGQPLAQRRAELQHW